MKNTEGKSSSPIRTTGKRKVAIWLGLTAVTATVGALLGNVSLGVAFGLLLGLPLITGGG